MSFLYIHIGQQFAESESVLDPKGLLTLKWRVDYVAQIIRFRVEFSDKAPSINWFALGFSDRGDLENSDICLVWTDYTKRDHFEVKLNKYIFYLSVFIMLKIYMS